MARKFLIHGEHIKYTLQLGTRKNWVSMDLVATRPLMRIPAARPPGAMTWRVWDIC